MRELRIQAKMLGKHQGVPHGHIGTSETVGTKVGTVLHGYIHGPQPGEKPARVVGGQACTTSNQSKDVSDAPSQLPSSFGESNSQNSSHWFAFGSR